MDHMNKFTGKSSAYTLSRPGYAKGLFEYLVCDLEVNKQTVIADIGSGTGKLSQDLLKVAGIVYCVEPMMRCDRWQSLYLVIKRDSFQ